MYHLEQGEPYTPDVMLGLPTSVSGLSDQQVVKLSKGPALAKVPNGNFFTTGEALGCGKE
jgi:hypothetical protein